MARIARQTYVYDICTGALLFNTLMRILPTADGNLVDGHRAHENLEHTEAACCVLRQ